MKHKQIFRLTMTGVLTALSVILTRYLVLVSTDTQRLSLGNIPVMLAGIACGPLYGAVCGLLSDAVGCFLSGYAPNIPLALAMGLIGFLPPMVYRGARKLGLVRAKTVLLCLSIVITNILAAVFWKTAVLSFMYGTPFLPNLAARLPFIAIETVLDAVVLSLIVNHPYFARRGVLDL